MTKTKKKEMRKKLVKVLNIISYILSGLMLIVLLITIIQGCSKKPTSKQASKQLLISEPQRAISYDYSEVAFKSTFTSGVISVAQQQLLTLGQFDLNEAFTTSGGNHLIPFYEKSSTSGSMYYLDQGVLYEVNMVASYFRKVVIDGLYYYRLNYIYVDYGEDNSFRLLESTTDNNYTGTIVEFITIGYATSVFMSEPLRTYVEEIEGYHFEFNKQFNYNAPMGLSVDSPYGHGATWTQSTQYTAHIDYQVGWFISNGAVYDTIQYWCVNADSSDYEVLSSSGTTSIKQGALGSWGYVFMYYLNSETNDNVIVNYRSSVAYVKSNDVQAYYYQNSSLWYNDAFRYVYFLDDLSTDMRNRISAFNNNNQYNGGIYSGGDNVFSLIGSAFTGLMPILSTMILPNITIGMLLLVPLVAMLVFAIIKIIKK